MKDSIAKHMFADHDRLNASLQELSDAVAGADSPTVQRVWTDFESGLFAHVEAEERHLFPLLEAEHEEEARALRAEHERIRAATAELGIEADLSTLRQEKVEALIALLRDHAQREAELLYRRADELMSAPARREALAWRAEEERRLRAAPRTARRERSRTATPPSGA